MLKAELFGVGRVRFYDRDLPGFPTQQSALLLCYLLLNRHRPQHREPLAAVFWGDYPTEISRKYLRNTLWRLRQMLQSAGTPPDDYLDISEDYVSFVNTNPCWIDVEQFEQSINRYQDYSGMDLSQEQAEDLIQATSLYSGDLLEDVYEDWCLNERERLRMLYLNSLNKIMTFYRKNREYENALKWGEKILGHDNTREKVHRQMMWLYWQLGDRNSAISQFKKCKQILIVELNVQPMEQTRHLYDQILAGNVQTDPEAYNSNLTHKRKEPSIYDPSIKPMIEQTLKRLHQLHQLLEETRAEINQMEHRIDELLVNNR